jgi:hypothetical protein
MYFYHTNITKHVRYHKNKKGVETLSNTSEGDIKSPVTFIICSLTLENKHNPFVDIKLAILSYEFCLENVEKCEKTNIFNQEA